MEQTSAASEFYSLFDDAKRKRLCRAVFDAYYEDQADKDILFDTSMNWTAKVHQLVQLFDDFKVVCCVRNPAWVMDSFEVIYRKNPFDYSRIYSPQTCQTVYSRCKALVSAGGAFGSAWTALKEAYYGEFSDRLLLIDYDLLTQYPGRSMELLYQFLGEPAILDAA